MFVYLKRRYFASVESWVKLCGLVLCAGAPLPRLRRAPGRATPPAPRCCWPGCRPCSWSPTTHAGDPTSSFSEKILLTSIFLVIAFASCFIIQYQSTPPFDGPFAAIVKTLVMMSSEFEYEGLFGDDHKEQLRETYTVVHLLFVVFVIFVATVLMNFMIGVAVSDISDLIVTGNIRRLEQQVKLLSTFKALAKETEFIRKYFRS